jgi:monoamine oxidase
MKAIIIGAGISGLYAAHLLKKAGISCEILEASYRYGGRIYSSLKQHGQYFELGAEIIHSAEPKLVQLLETSGNCLVPTAGQSFFWYQNKLTPQDELQNQPGIDQFLNELQGIEDYQGKDISLAKYFFGKKYFNADMHDVLETYAGEFGTSAHRLGIKSLLKEEDTWSNLAKNYYSHHPMQNSCEHFFNDVQSFVKLNTRIIRIDSIQGQLILTDQTGHQHESDIALLSVPLGVLKANDIVFHPALPVEKINAIRKLGVDHGIKIVMRFSKRWWPQDMLVAKGGHLCPEYLASLTYTKPTLVGFIMGKKALALKGKSAAELATLLSKELDSLFKHRRASKTLIEFYYKDWGNDPLHKGAYSFATTHSLGLRQILAKPIEDKLFFIGEACNTNGHASTIHGAMESALSVCEQIIGKYVVQPGRLAAPRMQAMKWHQ